MTTRATERFILALHDLEQNATLEPLLECFSGDCALSNLAHSEHGKEGARRFWTLYREQFADIRSNFSDVIETAGYSVLVWTAEGRLHHGQPIKYRGASILGWRDDRVARFETIYDSAAFVREQAKAS